MKRKKTKKKPPRKRWQFCWCDEESPPTKDGDSHHWKSKVFYAATFEKAMDRMLEFVKGKRFAVLVDYECAALHVPYDPEDHDAHFRRIDDTDHELADHLG